jgi:hypothetical protein
LHTIGVDETRLALASCWWRSDLLLSGVIDRIGVEFEAPITVSLGQLKTIGLTVATEVARVGDIRVT